jgi:diketogulonate reductase-like aldo/keto reductase
MLLTRHRVLDSTDRNRSTHLELRDFGGTGVKVSVIGQGTWAMERSRKKSIDAIRRGLDLGMTHIDTAEMYGSGAVEEIVGEAIADRREEVFLASKVLPRNASRRGTIEACERSLTRLRIDQLDLYLLHWPSSHPLEETISAFQELQNAGKIKFFGVSNFDIPQMTKAVALAGPRTVACNQVPYHLKQRDVETAMVQWCAENDVALVGYSPFGQGDFPKRSKVLDEIAREHEATSRQVALAFLTRFPQAFAIPKSSSVEHVEENAGAADLKLGDDEVARISDEFEIR